MKELFKGYRKSKVGLNSGSSRNQIPFFKELPARPSAKAVMQSGDSMTVEKEDCANPLMNMKTLKALLLLFTSLSSDMGLAATLDLPPSIIIPNYDRTLIGQIPGLESGAFVART